jgi:hypothetical protein
MRAGEGRTAAALDAKTMSPRSPSGSDGVLAIRCGSARRARWNEPERFTESAKSHRSAECGAPCASITYHICEHTTAGSGPADLGGDADTRAADHAHERLARLLRPARAPVDRGRNLVNLAHVRREELHALAGDGRRGEVEHRDVRARVQEQRGGRVAQPGRAVVREISDHE